MPFGIRFILTSTTGIKETFGRFTRIVQPGLNFYIPFIQKITPVSNRLHQDTFKFDVKTKDNVFARISIAVQYRIKGEDSQKAFYSLSNPKEQIDAYIENAVRSKVPQMELDHLFESHNDICHDVSEKLFKKMDEYGYTIENTLITEIEPSTEVRNAMNKINASKRLKEAATNDAEALYISEMGQARADRDRKRMQGEGISQQRHEILKGYEASIDGLASKLGLSPQEVIEFMMRTQHLDTLMSISRSPNTKTIFMEHDRAPGSQLKRQMMMANESFESPCSVESLQNGGCSKTSSGLDKVD